MLWFKVSKPDPGIDALSKEIILALRTGKKVLWFICGGSNIAPAVQAMNIIRGSVDDNLLPNLTVAQTDERYGPIGHKDSNWKMILDAGFDLNGIKSLPVLTGKSLKTAVGGYSDKIERAFLERSKDGGLLIGVFGIGADSHIAGILPDSVAVNDPGLICGYEAGQFVRITLTPSAMRKIDVVYAFAFGPDKKGPLDNLRARPADVAKEPCQILRELPSAYIYSDQ